MATKEISPYRHIGIGRVPREKRATVERVARAICSANGCDPDAPDTLRVDYGNVIPDVVIQAWQNYVAHALAAMKVLDDERGVIYDIA